MTLLMDMELSTSKLDQVLNYIDDDLNWRKCLMGKLFEQQTNTDLIYFINKQVNMQYVYLVAFIFNNISFNYPWTLSSPKAPG